MASRDLPADWFRGIGVGLPWGRRCSELVTWLFAKPRLSASGEPVHSCDARERLAENEPVGKSRRIRVQCEQNGLYW